MPPTAIDDEVLTSSFNWISAMSESMVGDAPRPMEVSMGAVQDIVMAEANLTSAPLEGGNSMSLVAKEEEDSIRCFLNDDYDDTWDLTAMNLQLDGLVIDCVGQEPPDQLQSIGNPCQQVSIPGLRSVPCRTSKGEDKAKSAKNDSWSLRRADQLRSALGMDVIIPFGDLPFKQIDEILSNLFSRVVKMNGEEYPSASINNMVGGFNRTIRTASIKRSLRGDYSNEVPQNLCIKKHPAFVATRLTICATVQKRARDGVNKKTKKVEVLTQCMEDAIFADIDHQISSSTGVQKWLMFYLMTRCGIRGGDELWEL